MTEQERGSLYINPNPNPNPNPRPNLTLALALALTLTLALNLAGHDSRQHWTEWTGHGQHQRALVRGGGRGEGRG